MLSLLACKRYTLGYELESVCLLEILIMKKSKECFKHEMGSRRRYIVDECTTWMTVQECVTSSTFRNTDSLSIM